VGVSGRIAGTDAISPFDAAALVAALPQLTSSSSPLPSSSSLPAFALPSYADRIAAFSATFATTAAAANTTTAAAGVAAAVASAGVAAGGGEGTGADVTASYVHIYINVCV